MHIGQLGPLDSHVFEQREPVQDERHLIRQRLRTCTSRSPYGRPGRAGTAIDPTRFTVGRQHLHE